MIRRAWNSQANEIATGAAISDHGGEVGGLENFAEFELGAREHFFLFRCVAICEMGARG